VPQAALAWLAGQRITAAISPARTRSRAAWRNSSIYHVARLEQVGIPSLYMAWRVLDNHDLLRNTTYVR